jgi:hypothetical protein
LFTTPANRHFYGHGVFSPDGRLLWATEHDNETRQGLLGVYSATQGYKRIGELKTFGIGPHEVILLADGRTLAVANGGIETHIETNGTGREKLNLDTMMPSLAFIDSATGDLVAQHNQVSDLHKLSIRHIAADARGEVWFGAQWEGDAEETPELVGFAGIDRPLRIIEPETPRGASLAGYIGAVAISGDKRILAASAPRAGRIVYAAFIANAMEGVIIDSDHWRHFYLLAAMVWGLMSAHTVAQPAIEAARTTVRTPRPAPVQQTPPVVPPRQRRTPSIVTAAALA